LGITLATYLSKSTVSHFCPIGKIDQGRLNKLDQATAKYPIKEQVTFQSSKLF
jgi:hypothetical protein